MPKLHNGLDFPAIHFGTFKLAGHECFNATLHALHSGYEAIDTATVYCNEEIVRDAIRASGKTPFVTTKLNPREMGYEAALSAFGRSVARLGADSVDLLLIHWPGLAKELPTSMKHRQGRIDTWRAFEEIYRAGKAKAIGVSNFCVDHLEQLVSDGATIIPMVNQVEIHVALQQRQLYEYCKSQGIILQAYSPLGGGSAPIIPILNDLKASLAVNSYSLQSNPYPNIMTRSASDIALKAASTFSDSVVIKSGDFKRMEQNLHTLLSDWDFTEEELHALKGLDTHTHFCWNPYTMS